jgi:hypothetical protein
MDDLARRAYTKLARFQITLAILIFVPAWSLTYWQGWLVWALFLICCVAITQYFLAHDPALIERRMESGPAAERARLLVGPRAGRAARWSDHVAPHR